MTAERDLVQAIIDANPYMTLATADEHGSPWVSPVWFATAGLLRARLGIRCREADVDPLLSTADGGCGERERAPGAALPLESD